MHPATKLWVLFCVAAAAATAVSSSTHAATATNTSAARCVPHEREALLEFKGGITNDPTGQLAYKFKSATAKAGKVTVESTNDASVPHNIALQGGPSGPVVQGGQTSKITANLKPGTYTFYCAVPGHEQAGMKGTLTVR
jgi:uncharacterized cupredoxin-like copper-binding protein